MAPIHEYKRKESEVVDRLGTRVRTARSRIGSFFKRTVQRGKQRFTVMFIPHSEKKIFNVQISVFTLLFFLGICLVLLLGFIGFSTHFTVRNRELVSTGIELRAAENELETYRDGIKGVRKDFEEVDGLMNEILNALDNNMSSVDPSAVGGDLSQFIPIGADMIEESQDLRDLRDMAMFLQRAGQGLELIKQHVVVLREFLAEIPTLWPVQGGHGYITQAWGPNPNVFTGEWYLHKGIDIAWGLGTPIVATADGVVDFIEDNASQMGQNVILKHNYGFSTRYGHLSRMYVVKGEEVRRGQVIGLMGNTGMSTGVHLHYEVRIAGQVVDPQKFLSVSGKWDTLIDPTGSKGM